MKGLKIFILVLFLLLPAYGQIDCYVASKISIKDPTGDLVWTAKVELFNTDGDNPRKFILEGKRKPGEDWHEIISLMGAFRGADGRHWSVDEDYVLKISAPGFKTYEQETKFYNCRGTDLEIVLKPLNSRSNGNVPVKKDSAILKGVVADTGHAPIKGVPVIVERSDGKIFQTATGEDGSYSITLEKGDYIIRYSAWKPWAERSLAGYIRTADFKPVYPISVTLRLNQHGTIVSEVECPLPPTRQGLDCKLVDRLIKADEATLYGTVYDQKREPIPRAVITATGKDGKAYTALSDWRGVYKLDLPKGEYEITFSFESTSFVYKNIKVDEASFGERNLDIILYPAGFGDLTKQADNK